TRYGRFGDLKDLDLGLQMMEESLKLVPTDNPDRLVHQGSLALASRHRFLRFGELKDLEMALHTAEEVLKLAPSDHPKRAGYLRALGQCYTDRYRRLGDLLDLEIALRMTQEAVDLTPADHVNRWGCLSALAQCFIYRYRRLKDVRNLETALHKLQEMVDLKPANLSNRAICLNSLAVCYMDKYQKWGHLEDLNAALQSQQEAVGLIPRDHPDCSEHLEHLTMCLTDRYRRLGDIQDLEEALQNGQEALRLTPDGHPARARCLQGLATSFAEKYKRSKDYKDLDLVHKYYTESFNTSVVNHPQSSWTAALIWALFSVDYQPSDAITAYKSAFNLLPEILWTGNDISARHDVARSLNIGLFTSSATKTCIELGDLTSAVEIIEQGLAITFQQILQLKTDVVDLPPEQVDMLRSLSLQLYNGTSDCLVRCNVRTQEGSVTASTRLSGQKKGCTSRTVTECFSDLLNWLWKYIVHPVYQVLALHGIYNGRLWWLASGAFTGLVMSTGPGPGLPLHASPPTDQFIHSYTATLGSLLEGRRKKWSATPKVGIVGVSHTGPGHKHYLKGVVQEVQNICSVVGTSSLSCLEGKYATPDAVKQQLQNCSWVHLACHGVQDLVKPGESHLMLYKGILELNTILQMPLPNAEFVFLAACQTAMGDAELVNESFHLGGGFIASGFCSAVGTLWSMNDQDGPLIAQMFYAHLFRNRPQPQVSETAEALQVAVNSLKARNAPFERWVPFIHMGI
ncbi:CHAT domain-containing protein, partial [Mycena pura]